MRIYLPATSSNGISDDQSRSAPFLKKLARHDRGWSLKPNEDSIVFISRIPKISEVAVAITDGLDLEIVCASRTLT